MCNFIDKAIRIHGNKYDYSKVEYVNCSTKVEIICPKHGEFWQTPNNHLHGYGCPRCKAEKIGEIKRSDKETFINKAIKVHGDKYDYSKVEYVNNSTKVCVVCPEHGEFWQTPNAHLRGCGCPKCSNVDRSNTSEFINKARKIHGDKYDYSKVEYVNNSTKVCIVCPEHGEFWQTPKNHLRGQGCNRCAVEQRSKKNTITTKEFVERAKKTHGDKYDYSKVEYVNNSTPVCIIDPKNGEFWQKPSVHLSGCGYNVGLKMSLNDFINKANEIHNNKYDYSKVEYTNANTKVCIVCKEHGEFFQTPHEHLRGSGCPKCGIKKRAIERAYTTEEFIKKSKEIHGDKYDYSQTKYISSDKEVEIICKKHGAFWQIATEHIQGRGCPNCCHHVSSYEKEIKDFLNNVLKIQTQENIRGLIGGNKEIDIITKDKKFAIELNGLFWHSENFHKDKNYHLNKTIECENNGIRLVHIFEDEWTERKNIVQSMLANMFGKTENKVFARKCNIKKVSTKEAMKFLDENHIQGKCKAKYHYGLYYNDVLVSVMSFGCLRQRRMYNDDYDNTYEIIRFCNKLNTNVVGGASKLLKHFIKEIDPHEIISYADRRWSVGKLYEKLGFTFVHYSQPNYYYVVGQKRENRFKYRKSELIKQGFDPNKSEHQIMMERGIYRIYDCGTLKYIWKKQCQY